MFISRRIELGRLEAFMSSADTAALVYAGEGSGRPALSGRPQDHSKEKSSATCVQGKAMKSILRIS